MAVVASDRTVDSSGKSATKSGQRCVRTRPSKPRPLNGKVMMTGSLIGKVSQCVPVHHRHVIALQIVFEEKLPIHWNVDRGFPKRPCGSAETLRDTFSLIAKPLLDRASVFSERNENNGSHSGRLQFPEPKFAPLQGPKGWSVWNSASRT